MTKKEKLESQIIHYKNEIGRAEWFIARGYNAEDNQEKIKRARREIRKREKELQKLEGGGR